jgi:putative GTP pyrophosphokinase
MGAWANVSHYLAYKGDASVPEHLRRDFYALSGLFYVADKHFELFYDQALVSARSAITRAAEGSLDEDDVDLETVQALLRQLYPARKKASPTAISDFVEEIARLGYTSIRELRETLQRFEEATRKDDARRGSNNKYNELGMARVSLYKADSAYRDLIDGKAGINARASAATTVRRQRSPKRSDQSEP